MALKSAKAMNIIEDTEDQLIAQVQRLYSDQRQISDDLLRTLNFFFQAPLLPALELVEKSSVFHMISPSDRSLYQVIGASGTPYTCFPGLKYCTCPAYQFSVLRKDNQLMCKHILAVKLAHAMDKLKTLTVSDSEIANTIILMD